MKNSLIAIALAISLPLVTFSAAQAQTAPKIAVIDLQRVFTEYYKTKDAEGVLKDRMAGFQKERDEMAADYQKMLDDTQKLHDAAQDKTLSDPARAEREKAFETKVQDLRLKERQVQEFNSTRQKQFQDQSLRMRTGIVDEINKYVTDVGAKEKYTMILDKSGPSTNGTPVLIYASPDLKDITDDVIKGINASKPATPAASTTSAAPATSSLAPAGSATAPSSTAITIPAAPTK